MIKQEIKNCRDFGKALARRRETLKLKQDDLVQIAPFGITYYSALENGKESAELGKAIEAARLLGLKLYFVSPETQG
jgi:transcriptional regulator with XRE-family HTH domain